jgi:ribosomal protein S18 acetylase RimI-like enzyme
MSISPFPHEQPRPLIHGEEGRRAVVRTVQQQDLPRLAELLASCFHAQDGVMGLFYPLLRMGIYEDLRNRFQTKTTHYACFVAVRAKAEGRVSLQQLAQMGMDECLMGTVLMGTVELAMRSSQFWSARPSGYLYLSNLAVQAEYRRGGVAQQLLQTCEQRALDWGFENLYLHVLENNYAARRLYRRAGYQLHGVETKIGSWLMGQPRQLFLRKTLIKNADREN